MFSLGLKVQAKYAPRWMVDALGALLFVGRKDLRGDNGVSTVRGKRSSLRFVFRSYLT